MDGSWTPIAASFFESGGNGVMAVRFAVGGDYVGLAETRDGAFHVDSARIEVTGAPR